MSVTIADKEPKAEEKVAESLSRRGSVDAAVSCFEQPTLGQALRDGKPGDIDYVNSFLHLLAQQQKIRKEQQTYPQAPTVTAGEEASSDDESESDDDDYRRRRGWKKRKLIWKDTYPPLKKGVRKKNRYKRRRSKEANTMQHTILQTLQTSGVAGPLPLQTNEGRPTTPEQLRESSMPDVRDMMSPAVMAAMESQQQQQQQPPLQPQQPQQQQQQQIQGQGQHIPSSAHPGPSPYVVPLPVAGAPMHPTSANAPMAMHATSKRDFDDFAFIEQSLLVHPPVTRCSEQQQQIAEEIMAEGRHGQLTAAMNPLNPALLQHPMPHAQHPMWQRAIHALPDNVALTDEHVDEFYGQRLWATFEDIFDTEAMAGIEESLQTASIQAHLPTLAAGAAAHGFGNGKTASTNQIWEEFFNE